MLFSLVLTLGLAASPAAGAPPTAKRHKTRIVVVETEDGSGKNKSTAHLINQVLVNEASRRPGVEVVSSSEIKQVLGLERQRQLLGCKENSQCLAELAGALGADLILSSEIGELGDRFRIDLRLVDGIKARVKASVGQFVKNEGNSIADAVPLMANALLDQGGLAPPPDTALAAHDVALSAEPPSRTPAYVLYAVAGAFAVGATIATLSTRSAYEKLGPTSPNSDVQHERDLAHLSDGLWAGALVSAGIGTYFFVRGPSQGGSGGELGVRGSF